MAAMEYDPFGRCEYQGAIKSDSGNDRKWGRSASAMNSWPRSRFEPVSSDGGPHVKSWPRDRVQSISEDAPGPASSKDFFNSPRCVSDHFGIGSGPSPESPKSHADDQGDGCLCLGPGGRKGSKVGDDKHPLGPPMPKGPVHEPVKFGAGVEKYSMARHEDSMGAFGSRRSLYNEEDDEGDDDSACFLGISLERRDRSEHFIPRSISEIKKSMKERPLDPYPSRLRDSWRGDFGLALFDPLDKDAFEPLTFDTEEEEEEPEEVPEEEEEILPLVVVPELPSILKESPPILNQSMMRQIRDNGLPPEAQIMAWHRIYSTHRDGDSFFIMQRKCEMFRHTVFVAETTNGELLGGYGDKPWGKQSGFSSSRTYFGGGRAFLFATDPANDEQSDLFPPVVCPKVTNEERTIYVYKWSGENTFSQIFDIDGEGMAMGGGNSFGIRIQDNFTRGTTGRCWTFHNPPLTKDVGGCFDIVNFEVYGLKTSLSFMY
mmetsp:Transcript_23672/g.47999  ORF Transcript_23672/g.47999 Transcript_23672/m.47999 type:complete len:487 (-) Transcript_23672:398-1858(-)|eukprot:CAMPEP_0183304912 /NCGR_PEP_ID=MMETSP0160_2-20130417/9827_1 /TAXON_ID=2839 ORGANISM="Odontella Sinensis, Strain Grunow 1884" /NCGR_SAMPLE_ID=MMETSP0160_2 /ASSEMBLY_ACC=CAM_ASM_000250 /LENGTH=486 /DNA_ID=CAMNT_0025468033 /DNA_START=32 /DNA_END=1492 /DNA_ORIENTATION=+